MSTTIDQRVVAMRFDNKHFEQNVSTTMSTLDKLKQKLHLDGATKGLQDVSTAAKKVDLSSLSSSADKVSVRFSYMQASIQHVLNNIVDSAFNAGKRIVSALTIKPVTTGFNEYELKMGSVQTIMASTGESLDTVNKYLQELNEYSDKTIYSFSDMTTNIGKFTNAGVKLEDAVLAIKGISNEAALSGANANEASRAMYNFSQALSAGYVKLIDWKSIENANMATVEFKQQLIDSAVEVGTLTKTTDGLYKTLDGTVIGATKNFNDSLQDQWMTTEVLVGTLRKYASETEDIGKKAMAAAQDVKTWTMLFDTLKEAAQSGWAQTWELIFGDFEEVKEFLTGLSSTIGGFLDSMSTSRNNILGNALNSNWDKLVSIIGEADISMNDFNEKVRELYGNDKKFDDLIEKFGSFEKAIKAGKIPADMLKKALADLGAGSDAAENKIGKFVEALKEVKRILGFGSVGDDVKALQSALEELGHSVGEHGIDGIIGPDTQKAIMEFQKAAGLVVDGIAGPDTLAALEKAGSSMNDLAENTNKAALEYDELIDNIAKRGGRELLLEGLSNVFKGLIGLLKTLGAAWNEVFPAQGVSNGIYNAIEAFNKFSKRLIITKEVTDKSGKSIISFTETGEKLVRIFKGVFSVIDTTLTLISGPIRLVFDIITGVLDKFGINLLDVFARFGDGLVKVNNAVETIKGIFTDVIVERISKWIEKFKETEFFKTCAEWIHNASEKISKALDNMSERFKDFNTSVVAQRLRSFADAVKSIASRISNSKIVVAMADGIRTAFGKLKDFFSGFKLPELNLDNLTWSAKRLRAFDGATGIGNFFSKIGSDFKDNILSWNWKDFKLKALTSFTEWWLTTGEKIKKAFAKAKEAFGAIKEFIFGTQDVDLQVIADLVEKFLKLALLYKTIQVLDNLTQPLDDVADGLNNLAAATKWEAMGKAFKAMAIAIGVLGVCLLVISQIPAEDAKRSAIILGALMVVLGGVVMGMAALSSKMDGGFNVMKLTLGLLMLAGSIAIIVHALKEIDNLHLKNYWGTFGTLGLILMSLSLGLKLISKSCNGSLGSVVAVLTMLAGIKMMLEIIDAYDAYNWNGKLDAVLKMFGMLVLIAAALNIASRGLKAGANMHGMAMTILAMVISLKLMVGTIEDFASLSDDQLKRGGAVVVALISVMTGMIAVANLTSKGAVLAKGERNVNNFTGLAIALLATVGAIYLLGKMATQDFESFKAGMIGVSIIITMFTGMLAAIGATCSNLKMGKIVALLIAFGVIFVLLWQIVKQMDALDPGNTATSAASLGGLLLAMAGVLYVFSKQKTKTTDVLKWVGVLAALGIVIGLLAHILKVMDGLDPIGAVANATALGILLSVMAGVVFILTKIKISKSDIGGLIASFAGMGALLAAIRWLIVPALTAMDGLQNAANNAIAIGILMLALGVIMPMIAVAGKISERGVLAGVLGIAAVMAAILLFLVPALNGMKDLNNATDSAIALGILMLALGITMPLIAAAGAISRGALVGAVAVAAVMAAIRFLLVPALEAMDGLQNARANAVTLAILAGALSLCMIPLALAGSLVYGALIGVVALGAVMLELNLIVLTLTSMEELTNAQANAEILINLITTLTDCLFKISMISPLAIIGVTALTGLFTLITTMGLVVTAVGAILEKAPAIETFVDNGLDLFVLLAEGLGRMVSAFAVGLTSGLVKVGENLSAFASSIMPFALTMSALGPMGGAILNGAKNLSLAIISLLASDLVAGLADLMGLSLTDLAEDLSGFGEKIGDFVTSMSGIDASAAAGVEALCSAINALVSANLKDAIVNILPGDNSLSTFGENISAFAGCIKDAATSLKEITDDDVANIKRSAEAGTALAELNAAIPRQGGWFQEIAGSKELAAFGESIVAFADCIISYSDKVSNQNINKEAVIDSAEAGKSLAELEKAIPRKGGWLQTIAGSKELEPFGESIVAFADCLIAYSDAITGSSFDSAAVKSSAEAAKEITGVYENMPKKGGIWQDVAGEKDLADFGESLVTFGESLAAYATVVKGEDFDTDAIVTTTPGVIGAVESINSIIKLLSREDGLIQGITGIKDAGSFGEKLTPFIDGVKEYGETVEDVDTDAIIDSSKNMKRAIRAIVKATKAIEEEGGLEQGIYGTKEIGEFGTDIKTLAEGLRDASKAVGDIDQDNLSILATSITNLGQAAWNIQADGGLIQLFTGTSDLVGFAKELPALAQAIADACDIAEDIKRANLTILTDAITDLGTAAQAIENEGGLKQLWTGVSDVTGFTNDIRSLAAAVRDACNEAATITVDEEAIGKLGTAIYTLATATQAIENDGGDWQLVFGTSDVDGFMNNIVDLVIEVYNACNWARSINPTGLKNFEDAMGSLTTGMEKIENKDGLMQSIFGNSDVSGFMGNVVGLVEAVQDACEKSKDIDTTSLYKFTSAMSSLVLGMAYIENKDGLLSTIFGNNDVAGFMDKIVGLVTKVYSACNWAAKIDTSGLGNFTRAMSDLVTGMNEVENKDDILDKVMGTNDVAGFMDKIVNLVTQVKWACNIAETIPVDEEGAVVGLGKFKTAMTNLTAAMNEINNDDGLWQKVWGTNDTAGFITNIKPLVENVKTACETASEIPTDNIDTLESAIGAIVTALAQIPSVDGFVSNWGGVVDVDGFTSSIYPLVQAIYNSTMLAGAINLSNLSNLTNAIWVLDLAISSIPDINKIKTDKFVKGIKNCVEAIEMAGNVKSWNVNTFKLAIENLGTVDIDGTIDALVDKAGPLSDAITSLVDAACTAVASRLDDFKTAGEDLGNNLKAGVNSKHSEILKAGQLLGRAAHAGANDTRIKSQMTAAGKNLGDGLIIGINNKYWDVYWAAYDLGQAAVDGEKAGQDSQSPSKLTIKAGKWLGEGLVIGMGKMTRSVYNAGHNLGDSATNSISSTISKISDAINTDIDSQPTIRPVLDLSDVRSGASSINSLFNGGASVGLLANVNNISSAMNRRGQNGVNGDVVSAIDKLSRKMDNINNAQYVINGVTYDDGSNIQDAVGTLIRAANIARRV